ncbi:hypothetical protein QN277_007521 [Acacia crassicarpa]|uniref:HSF-type DNA-binding domain-containing protein n=1 Tax=Acacia crassicarpa TaxID=499986 RepID=A0AAE1M8W5_9FABA|nr:hypothetical protein QN277_007521 [Acacia crassicarpa]
MNRVVKEEIIMEATATATTNMAAMAAAAAPQPMQGLHEGGPPPFLTKTYDIVDDVSTNHIVSWSGGYNSFVVWDPQSFSMSLLPRLFKHSNFSSFVRQLNTYGFRKVDPDRWEFANEGFLRGQKHLLKNIRRKKTRQQQQHHHKHHDHQALDSCVEVGQFGLDGEVNRLRRDKQVLMLELVKLRQQQQNTKTYLQQMKGRLKRTEQKQQQMMNFLARSTQNPNFVQQLVQQKEWKKELEEEISKKRRTIDQGPSSHNNDNNVDELLVGQLDCSDLVEILEPNNNIAAAAAGDLDLIGKVEEEDEQHNEVIQSINREKEIINDEDFWQDLLNNEDIVEVVRGFQDRGGIGKARVGPLKLHN